jgi:hypothetical protein
MIRASFRSAALAAALALVPALALAQPVITSITPASTSANTGETVTVSGTGFGAANDRVYFPGTNNFVLPTSSGAGWVVCRVPGTWSGNVQVQSHGSGALSNSVNHDISFVYHGAKWASGTRTWYLNSSGAPGCAFSDVQTALVRGLDTWSCASGLSHTYGGTTSLNASSLDDGYNVQCWYTSGWNDPNIIASAGWYSVAGDIQEFDIAYNAVHYSWSTSGLGTAMDVQSIATHEEGHVIGFYDLYGVADAGKTMYGYSGAGQTDLSTLSETDIQGAEWLYPHVGRADLTYGTPAGWYAPVVPRNTNTATATSAILPATLNGNTTTYVSSAMTNSGGDCAAPWSNNALSLDDAIAWNFSWAGVWQSGSLTGAWLNYPIAARGGRHTLKLAYDTNADILESNEANNLWQGQYVWSPYALANESPVYRGAPPPRGSLAAPNCDGFAFTGGWWGLVAIQPTASNDDYDLQLFNDYTGSTAGFSAALKTSAQGQGLSDFVLVNGNKVGNSATRWAGVNHYAGGSAANFIISQSNASITHPAPATYGSKASITDTIAANQIALVYEVRLDSTNIKYHFHLRNLSGSADLNLTLYDQAGSYFAKSDYIASSLTTGGATDEEFDFQPSAPGYYGLVVWKRGYLDATSVNRYTLEIGPALGNLTANVALPHWDSPVVPRNDAAALVDTAAVSPVLDGNLSSTRYTWTAHLTSWVTTPTWRSQVSLDGVQQGYFDYAGKGDVPLAVLNLGSFVVRGGRHTLTSFADCLSAVEESNETDNTWSGQWVWSPFAMGLNVPVVRGLPPERGGFTQPNSDGLKFTRTNPSTAWVVSLAAQTAGDDYDLHCYDDYTGSSAGFSNLRTSSTQGSNATDFVVGHYSGTPTNLYPAAVRYATSGGGGAYFADASDATGRNGNNPGGQVQFKNQVLATNRLADVYEAYFFRGTTYHLLLLQQPGDADLAFEVFPSTAGGIYKRGQYDAAVISTPVNAATDTLAFTAPASGWYPIVVYRTFGTNTRPQTYEFDWMETSIVAVPGEAPPAAISFAGAAPNPVVERARFEFALPQPATVRLELFDLNGRLVRTLAEGRYEAGRHQAPWDGTGRNGTRLGTGLFWARLEVGGKAFTKRVTVLR